MKAILDSRGLAVCDLEWERNGGYDEGAYLVGAQYVRCSGWIHRLKAWITGQACRCPNPVPEDELEYLTDSYPELGDEFVFESAVDAAERFYEGDR